MRWLVVLALSVLAVSAARAQSPSSSPPFEDTCWSAWGHFSHWSAVQHDEDQGTNIGWTVCNLDSKVPLIFKWDSPQISTGNEGSLSINSCAMVRLPVPDPEPDRHAAISYTQGSRSCGAPAYVEKLPGFIPKRYLPRALNNFLRTVFIEGPTQPSAIVQVKVVETREGNRIHHLISWDPPSVTLMMSADYFQGQQLPQFSKQAYSEGYSIHVEKLGEVLGKESGLSAERLSSMVVIIDHEKGAPLEFDTEVASTTIAMRHLTLLGHYRKSMIIDVPISSFAAAQK